MKTNHFLVDERIPIFPRMLQAVSCSDAFVIFTGPRTQHDISTITLNPVHDLI